MSESSRREFLKAAAAAAAATAAGLPLPVFALGGLAADDMERARDAGAHGIAAIRAIWRTARE